MEEIWKSIEGYEGLYEISNYGRVKSLERKILAGKGCNHKYNTLKERYIATKCYGKYPAVVLCKNGITKRQTIHRLVARAFLPNPNNLPCINHKDENKLNNRADNLEWCSYKYNNEYHNRVQKCKSKISSTLKGRPLSFKWTDEQKKRISESVKRSWIIRHQKSAITEQEEI